MKVGIVLKGKVISKEPIELGAEKLTQLRAIIVGLGLKGLPKEWRFFHKDDELPKEAENTINATTLAAAENITIGPAKETLTASPAAASTTKDSKPAGAAQTVAATKTATTKAAAGAPGKPTASTSTDKPQASGKDEPAKPGKDENAGSATKGKPAADAAKSATNAPAADASKPKTDTSSGISIKPGYVPDRPQDSGTTLPDDGKPSLQDLFGAATNIGESSLSTAGLTIGMVLNAAYERGKFPQALGYDDGLSPRAGAVKLEMPTDSADSAADFKALAKDLSVTLYNLDKIDSQAFEREDYRSLYKSTAYSLATAGTGKAVVEGVSLKASDSTKIETKESKSEVERTRNLFVSSIRKVTRAEIALPRALIRATQDVEDAFKAALESYLKAAAGDFSSILRVLETHGAVIPTTYLLGGQIYAHQEWASTDEISTISDETQAAFAREFEMSVADTAGGSRRVEAGVNTGSKESNQKATRSMTFSLQQIGGEIGLAKAPSRWIDSLANPGTWELVGTGRPLPIWEFFEHKHRGKWRQAASKIKAELARLMSDEAAKLERLESLIQAQLAGARVPIGSVENNNVRRALGVENVPGSIKHSPISIEEDWGYLGRSGKTSLPVPAGHVITYVRLFTAFDPPGTYTIESGGVLSNHMNISFKQESLRGIAWHIDFQTAKPDQINVSPRYAAMNALYWAIP